MSRTPVVRDRDRTFRAGRHADEERVRGASLTEAQRDSLTPDQVVKAFLDGNARFVSGRQRDRDFLGEMKSSAEGQYPAADRPLVHRFPHAGRSDLRSRHRRYLQREGRRQCRQRRHPRLDGVRVRGRRRQGGPGARPYVVRRDQGSDRQRRPRQPDAVACPLQGGDRRHAVRRPENVEERGLRRRRRANAGPQIGPTGAPAQRGAGRSRGRRQDQDRRSMYDIASGVVSLV